jgi:hypothetical protein
LLLEGVGQGVARNKRGCVGHRLPSPAQRRNNVIFGQIHEVDEAIPVVFHVENNPSRETS